MADDDIYVELADGVVKAALDIADVMEKALTEHWQGVPFGQKELTDLEFITWYDKMMASNPNWQPATMFTPDGEHDLQRYLRARTRLAQQLMTEEVL